jgi:hypothetical protein
MSDLSDEINDLHQLREHLTLLVHNWMFLGAEDGVDAPHLAELMAVVRGERGILPLDEAAERLRVEFEDRQTCGAPGFHGLWSDLISTALNLVDWRAIVNAMRMRED